MTAFRENLSAKKVKGGSPSFRVTLITGPAAPHMATVISSAAYAKSL